MQPKLKPVAQKYIDMQKKLSDAGKKAVEEMAKQPYTMEEAMENQHRLMADKWTDAEETREAAEDK